MKSNIIKSLAIALAIIVTASAAFSQQQVARRVKTEFDTMTKAELEAALNEAADACITLRKEARDLSEELGEAWRSEKYTSDEIAALRGEFAELQQKLLATHDALAAKVGALPEVQALRARLDATSRKAEEAQDRRDAINAVRRRRFRYEGAEPQSAEGGQPARTAADEGEPSAGAGQPERTPEDEGEPSAEAAKE